MTAAARPRLTQQETYDRRAADDINVELTVVETIDAALAVVSEWLAEALESCPPDARNYAMQRAALGCHRIGRAVLMQRARVPV